MWIQTGEFGTILPQLIKALGHLTCTFFWGKMNLMKMDCHSESAGPQNLSHPIPQRYFVYFTKEWKSSEFSTEPSLSTYLIRIFIYLCSSYLLLYDKLSQNLMALIIIIYYLTVSVDQEFGSSLATSFGFRLSHESKCHLRPHSFDGLTDLEDLLIHSLWLLARSHKSSPP